MQKRRVTIEELEKIISNKNPNEIEVEILEYGKSVVIDPVLLKYITAAYKFDRHEPEELHYWSLSTATATDVNFDHSATPEYGRAPKSNEIIEIESMLASVFAAAVVADRVLTIEFSPGMHYDIGAALDFFFNSNDPAGDQVTVSTGQYGYIYYDLEGGLTGIGHTNDNGTWGALVNSPRKMIARMGSTQGGQLSAHLNNRQTADIIRLSLFYAVKGYVE